MGPNRVLELTRGTHGKSLIFKVDKTWVHLPGSQGIEPGSGQTFFFFFKIDHLDLGTCPRTQQDTWTHVRFTVNKFDFSDLTGLWTVNHVHREEELGPDKLF